MSVSPSKQSFLRQQKQNKVILGYGYKTFNSDFFLKFEHTFLIIIFYPKQKSEANFKIMKQCYLAVKNLLTLKTNTFFSSSRHVKSAKYCVICLAMPNIVHICEC